MMTNPLILLIGGGKMGQALAQGWLASGIPAASIMVVEPEESLRMHIQAQHQIQCVAQQRDVPSRFVPEVVVLAVKPQIMADITTECAGWAQHHALFISIAAGKTLGFFSLYLGNDAAVIRAMPNMPALISKGTTAYVANHAVSEKQLKMAEKLLLSVGSLHRLENEALMDAVTAISGSGPAYVFYFIECLIRAATELGLPEDLAKSLVMGTLKGSADLAYGSSVSPGALKAAVASPGGTTQAALDILIKDCVFEEILMQAVRAAKERSEELSE